MLKIRKDPRTKKYFIDYTFGPKGKRQRKKIYGFGSRAEAETMKTQIVLRPLDQALDFQSLTPTPLPKAVAEYQKTHSKKKASKRGEEQYFQRLMEFFESRRKDPKKNFDGMVASITLFDIQEFQNHLLSMEWSRSPDQKNSKAKVKTLSAATVNRHFHTYRNFFEQCRLWNFIRQNPCEFLKDALEEEKPIMTWTAKQCAEVLVKLPDWAQRFLLFAAKTGGRRGEICNLVQSDVYLDQARAALKSRKGKGNLVVRYVPLTKSLQKFMADQLRLALAVKAPRVFFDETGGAIDPVRLSTMVNRAAKKAGHPGLNLKALRHTILSKMAHDGTSLRDIQKLAGHTNLRTTQKYLHTQVDDIREAMERVEDE